MLGYQVDPFRGSAALWGSQEGHSCALWWFFLDNPLAWCYLSLQGGTMNIKAVLSAKLAENYENLFDFHNSSKIPLARETCRRAINEGVPVNITSIAIICLYLGFTNAQTKDILAAAGDKDFIRLMSDQSSDLTDQERALLNIYKSITSKDPLADHLALLAKADDVNISRDLKALKKGG